MQRDAKEDKYAAAHNAALCPSCERFIGAADVCPYCGTDSARRPLLKHLRRAALLLAVAGVAGLYLLARQSSPPVVKVGDVSPRMNFAVVRIGGCVAGGARVLREGDEVDYLSFPVNDGSGTLRVVAEGPVAAALAAGGGIPEKGERVEIVGTLNVSVAGSPRLRLHSDGQLRRLRGPGDGRE